MPTDHLLLAVALARRGAAFVVVGSAVDRLVTGRGLPADLDILVPPRAVPALARALTDLTGSPVRLHRLMAHDSSRFLTWLGPIDVFVDDVAGPSTVILVDGTWLRVTTGPHPGPRQSRTVGR